MFNLCILSDAALLLTAGSFLLTVELLFLQLCLGAFLLTIAVFSLTATAELQGVSLQTDTLSPMAVSVTLFAFHSFRRIYGSWLLKPKPF